jgi:predicted SAM-dependent methyltransferase
MIAKVHVGCGPKAHLKGWWNTDLRSFPGVDQALDATQPWPWRDQLTHVYSEHFLEHLELERAVAFLVHAGNALKPGGRIRLSTPNLVWVMGCFMLGADVATERRLQDTLAINRAFHGWEHKFLWSEEMLAGLLGAMGFERIEPYAFGESDDPELRSIEQHANYLVSGDQPSVVILEAIRGSRPIALDPAIGAWMEHEFIRYVRDGH